MKKLTLINAFLLVAIGFLNAQTLLTGTIYNDSGEPLPGATVEILDLDLVTATDAYGFFKVPGVSNGKHTLRVNYIGFKTYETSFVMEENTSLDVELQDDVTLLQSVEVNSLRLDQQDPFSFTNLDEEEISKNNLGQDIPYLLRNTPSVVATSDAGAGIGYTGVRVRGSDATRTNVVINDIPLNDSESQGVFWVNLPDLASSTNTIQVQRGVGASTNGAGAFGASVNIGTKGYDTESSIELSNTFGSFNTRKHTLNFNSGLLDNKLAFEGRVSWIASDGYIDRASSDLRSAYLSAGYFADNMSIQAIALLGSERTFQSWFGSPQSRVEGDLDALQTHYQNNVGVLYFTAEDSLNLFNSDRRYNYYLYDDQVDDYKQDHYQLHFNNDHANGVSTKIALHYTKGRGFFEEFRFNDFFSNYGFNNPIVNGEEVLSTNLVRRRWLDNDFYGIVGSVNFGNDNTDVTLGGAFHRYDGDHFGEIIQADISEFQSLNENYYTGVARKDDANIYAKFDHQLVSNLNVYADVQLRYIDYTTNGTDNDLVQYDIDEEYTFFNPKLGLTYSLTEDQILYTSFGVANKEPARSDFIAAEDENLPMPVQETLFDFELGYKKQAGDLNLDANLYYMSYNNQLVATGELNDVGALIRRNVEDSFRAGIELNAAYQISKKFSIGANATFSQNKIAAIDEVLVDFSSYELVVNSLTDTDIAYSPNVIAGGFVQVNPISSLELGLYPKYVGRQFLDNFSNDNRVLDAYFDADFLGSYQIPSKKLKDISVNLKVNNVFNSLYSANGYTYSFIFGDLITENFLYPQAGINFLAGLTLKF